MQASFKPRVCKVCNKGKGTMAFRWKDKETYTRRDYFHPACFKGFLISEGLDGVRAGVIEGIYSGVRKKGIS